ncbi:MAG: hypothetical protein Q8M31_15240 [Beijerinckiaceae bacterium]|nr:hypothetical protein [Beijerinckiaceae bacterium]
MIHPLYVLGLVMFLGIVAWPVARSQGFVPRGMEADLIAVAVLILSYMAYKSWWHKQQGK